MDSVKVTDDAAAAVASKPRVSLADIEAKIAGGARYEFTAGSAVRALGCPRDVGLDYLSVCIVRLDNGFVVIGKSAPASPENFNEELGRRLAYEDCIRQIWPLMGFALREQLAAG